jgi:hypothetical protein
MFGENVSSLPPVTASHSRNVLAGVLGLRIANWAREIRSSRKSLSVMTSPKGSFGRSETLVPSDAVTKRRNTRHDHGPSPRVRRHSIGHLHKRISTLRQGTRSRDYAHLVHASPGAFKSGIPEIAWIRDDLPELWEPTTTMLGRSMYRLSLPQSVRRAICDGI